jgi:O-antigen/teichoic acid export membrane protein
MTDNHSQHHQPEQGGKGFFSREAMGSIPWMVLSKLVLFFLYFGISILTVNALGKEKYGIYSLMVNISTYLLMLCGLGLGVALMRYVPELAARKNRFGLIHLLWKSAALQLVAVVAVSVVLVALSDPLQRLFKAEHVDHFRFYLKLACGLTGLLLLKEYVGTVFTSLFKTRTVAILSITSGIIWFATLWSWLVIRPEVETVFAVQLASVGAIYLIGAGALVHYVKNLPWNVKEFGIGKKRALVFSGTVMLSSILRVVMFKYSEIFFLAAVAGTTVAGIYDLGYTLPYTVITFLPLAFMPIFTAAFAEAYVKDNDCLGRLIKSYYKLLMMVSLPFAVLGSYFCPVAYHILYDGKMDEAGFIASALCIVLVLPLFSMPLSAAIKAKEKVLNMMPMLVLQLVVNLFLDWYLIVLRNMGVWGGIIAVAGTFVLTIPFRLHVVRRIIGGIYFPAAFCLRITAALAGLGWAFQWVVEKTGLFGIFENRVVNIGFLFGIGALYLIFFLLAIRYLHLVRRADIEDFEALEIRRLNAVLAFLVR